MKTAKKILSVLLAIVMTFSLFVMSASAEDETENPVLKTKELSIINYNVAGLPVGLKVPSNQSEIGKIVTKNAYDIVAVQEDFNLHYFLNKNISEAVYPYRTKHTGGVPGGDGLNIYSRYPIYNAQHTSWSFANGVFDAGADELTPKGVLFAVIDLGDGVYVDYYNLHFDANGTDMDSVARIAQIKQLRKIIEYRNSKNPIIISGDFNSSIYYYQEDSKTLKEEIYDDLGFKDAWFEVHNEGEYTLESLQEWVDMYGGYGYTQTKDTWNSIEKVLFKDGENVKLTATSFEYTMFTDKDGNQLSDHPAAIAEITCEVTGEITANQEEFNVANVSFIERIKIFIKGFISALSLILTNLDTI